MAGKRAVTGHDDPGPAPARPKGRSSMLQATRRLSWLLATVLVLVGLSACENTIRGVGQDTEETGDAVEDAVQ